MPETLTTEQLLREVRHLTADLPVEDGRVAKELTERNVRYYVTIGVVRPPIREANRSIWTRDHVLDLVRVRRAQAMGLSLKLIGSPASAHSPSAPDPAMSPAMSWRAANSPALRSSPVDPTARHDTGWTVRLSPDLQLTGFGSQPTDHEIAAVRAALRERLSATPPRKDDHR